MKEEELEKIEKKAQEEIDRAFAVLKKDAPGVYELIYTSSGAAIGGTISIGTLSSIGAVSGLSAPGITSGLATAGTVVGGGMAAGVVVLATPVLILGVGGYIWASKRKRAKVIAAVEQAIKRLYNTVKILKSNAVFFRDKLAEVNLMINRLEKALKGMKK